MQASDNIFNFVINDGSGGEDLFISEEILKLSMLSNEELQDKEQEAGEKYDLLYEHCTKKGQKIHAYERDMEAKQSIIEELKNEKYKVQMEFTGLKCNKERMEQEIRFLERSRAEATHDVKMIEYMQSGNDVNGRVRGMLINATVEQLRRVYFNTARDEEVADLLNDFSRGKCFTILRSMARLGLEANQHFLVISQEDEFKELNEDRSNCKPRLNLRKGKRLKEAVVKLLCLIFDIPFGCLDTLTNSGPTTPTAQAASRTELKLSILATRERLIRMQEQLAEQELEPRTPHSAKRVLNFKDDESRFSKRTKASDTY